MIYKEIPERKLLFGFTSKKRLCVISESIYDNYIIKDKHEVDVWKWYIEN